MTSGEKIQARNTKLQRNPKLQDPERQAAAPISTKATGNLCICVLITFPFWLASLLLDLAGLRWSWVEIWMALTGDWQLVDW